ncbi:MAG: hypothetical protein R3B13_20340 [Polyangiaceae bacterium]
MTSRAGFAIGLVLVFVNCGGVTSASSDSSDAGGAPAVGGAGLGGTHANTGGMGAKIGLDPPPTLPKDCPYPTQPSTDEPPKLQAWCEGTGKNPAACPVQAAESGSACDSPGLACAYASATGAVHMRTCNSGSWQPSASASCKQKCGDWIHEGEVTAAFSVPTASCTSLEPIPCVGDAPTTSQRVIDTIQAITECCGPAIESTIELRFDNGCVTEVVTDRAKEYVTSCFVKTLTGRRLTCAQDLSCGSVTWTTLQ